MSDTVDRHAESDPVRVAILNDYEVVVEGVAAMLRQYPDRVLVQDVSTAAKPGERVDVVLFDMFATSDRGAHWSDFMASGWAPRYVVQYGWEVTGAHTGQDAGRDMHIPKTVRSESLVEIIEHIARTGRYPAGTENDPPASAADADAHQPSAVLRSWPGKREGLTERQSEVLALIVAGLSNDAIAEELFLSVNTIKAYIRSAYETMGVTSRSTAVLWGIDHGFRPHRPSR